MVIESLSVLAAFEFGSFSMLAWLAAAVLPWLIHRWNRRRHRTMRWAAVELLLIAVRQRARRVQLQQWLLIAVRTAILVLVALAAAEPAFRQWSLAAHGTDRIHLVIVVDQSYSMSNRQQDRSRLQSAKELARRLIESRSRGDLFSVLGWSQSVENIMGRATDDATLALAAIEGLKQEHASAELQQAVQASLAAIERADDEASQSIAHQVVFLSDLCRNTWQEAVSESAPLDQLADQASLSLVDVGDNQRNNSAITGLSVDPAIALRQREVVFTATLRSFGNRKWDDVPIELHVDGRQVARQQVNLSPGSDTKVQFPYRFANEGERTVHVSLVGDVDGLPMDNQRWLVVEVKPQLRVACLAGKPRAADDIARALSPNTDSAAADQAILSEVISFNRLAELDLTVYDAIFLCNASGLISSESDRLARYVRQGGGLAIMLGEQSAKDQFNKIEPDPDFDGLLPAEILQRVTAGGSRFDPLDYQHPITTLFRGKVNAGLSNVAIEEYFQLDVKETHPTAEVVLAFETGDPALVVDQYGLGRVAVVALPGSLASRTAEGTPWSSFPVSPSFLPIIRELATYLVGASWLEEHNLFVGQPAVCQLDSSRQISAIEVSQPDGSMQLLASPGIEDQGQLTLAETEASGIYTISAASEAIARFAVNLDTRESDLAAMEIADLSTPISTLSSNSSSTANTASFEFSFARDLLFAAILLLLLELLLAWWLSRGWQ